MYNAFRRMINDLFNNEQFVQFCYVNGFKYKCIVSKTNDGVMFTEAGMQDLVNFTLDLQLTEQNYNNPPEQNDRVVFREKEYKISHVELDSSLSTVRLYMVSNSRGK